MRTRLLISVILWLFALPALALEVPPATGYVTDNAGMISQTVQLKLEQFLRDFEKSDSTQLTVLTIPTLESELLEEYALQVLDNWKVGQKGLDNGALLLIAKAERKIRIEVGYGLEGRLTDLLAGRIIDNEISPRFKAGDIDGGIVSGVVGMAEAVRGEYTGSGKTTSKKKSSPLGFLFPLLFFGVPLLSRLGGQRGHRRSGMFYGGPFTGGGRGGFGGGGGFSGGGGGGGGGGASGGW